MVKKVVRLSIPKLDDANKAGTSESLNALLFLQRVIQQRQLQYLVYQ